MEARILPFRQRAGAAAPVAAGAALALLADEPAVAELVAEVSLELRMLPRPDHRVPTAEAALRDRVVMAAMRCLADHGGILRLAGTEAHPVVEARFCGEDPASLAVRAASGAADAVRRAGAREFVAAVGAGAGRVAEGHGGVHLVFGSPESVAGRLREAAAPGQVLLGGSDWAQAGRARLSPGKALPGAAGLPPVPVFVLRGLS